MTASSLALRTGSWGLRDYGTGSWEGGDPDCDHQPPKQPGRVFKNGQGKAYASSNTAWSKDDQTTYKDVCGKCGARRQDQQLGLEPTPDQYVQNMVAVFREVRRVLADHGTCWVNLGDSYAGSWGAQGRDGQMADRSVVSARQIENHPQFQTRTGARGLGNGLKPKDLCGIPWKVAQALQAPYYTGDIPKEADRAWLAAIVDSEGCIYISRSKTGATTGRDRKYTRTQDAYDAGVRITNTNRALLERVAQIVGHGKIREATSHGQQAYEWNAYSSKARKLLRELYPHLVAKQHEARLAIGHPPSGDDARKAHESLKAIHQGLTPCIDFREPEGMWERGWYLRSEIIWSKKPNPMPESVTDRPTKAHEQIFLLTKEPRYWFDAEAVREPQSTATIERFGNGQAQRRTGKAYHPDRNEAMSQELLAGRNVRSVWEIATQPYPEAHFATYPEELVRRCLLAGCPEQVCGTCGKPRERIVERTPMVIDRSERTHDKGNTRSSGTMLEAPTATTLGWSDCGHNNYRPGIVLDPFIGSGTTAVVARRHGRHTIGIELNPAYAELAARRTRQLSLLA